jgi:hypothetical protein
LPLRPTVSPMDYKRSTGGDLPVSPLEPANL